MAQRFGVNQHTASAGLATLLPTLIDQLRPKGQIIQGDELSSLLNGLREKQ